MSINNLSSDELLLVLLKLGIVELWHAKQVCKKWHNAIDDNMLQAHGPWVVTAVYNRNATSGVDAPDHHEVWFPKSGLRRRVQLPNLSALDSVVASSGGLVCKRLDNDEALALVVGNPLTNKWDVLPKVVPLNFEIRELFAGNEFQVHMEANSASGDFKIVAIPSVVKATCYWHRAVEYDSKTPGVWRHYPSQSSISGPMPFSGRNTPLVEILDNRFPWSVLVPPGGIMNLFTWAEFIPDFIKDDECKVPFFYSSNKAFRTGGRKLLWIAATTDNYIRTRGFSIFELDLDKLDKNVKSSLQMHKASSAWKLLSSVTVESLYGRERVNGNEEVHAIKDSDYEYMENCEFISKHQDNFIFEHQDNFICIVGGNEFGSGSRGKWPPAVFNLITCEWATMDKSSDLAFDGSFTFVPSLKPVLCSGNRIETVRLWTQFYQSTVDYLRFAYARERPEPVPFREETIERNRKFVYYE